MIIQDSSKNKNRLTVKLIEVFCCLLKTIVKNVEYKQIVN